MASLSQNFKNEAREGLRDYFEEKTGIFGQALRAQREARESKKKNEGQAELISVSTQKLKTTAQALSSMEASFIQISKNMQIIAQAMGAEAVLRKETDEIQKKIADINEKKQQLLRDANKKRQNDLQKLNRKINDTFKQDQNDKKQITYGDIDVMIVIPIESKDDGADIKKEYINNVIKFIETSGQNYIDIESA